MLRKFTAGIVRYRRRLLAAVVVTVSIAPLALINGNAGAATALAPQPGNFTGLGFDACTAPSSDTMAAWLRSSPYRAAGIYFGGNNRGCTQANLTADWVREQITRGWRLIPLYVGPQASCTTLTKRNLIDNATAAAQGRATAEDAVRQAVALGLSKESVLIYDMESYDSKNIACRDGVLTFMNAWTARLHDFGYFSGYYSSAATGIADMVAVYHRPGYVRPDYIDFARWDQVVTVTDKVIPANHWAPQRRMKQYRGAHQETWGGVTINIDNDYLDFARLPSAKLADWNRNGWSDIMARTSSTGNLFAYPGNGTWVSEGGRTHVGVYPSANALLRMDLDRNGLTDLIVRTRAGAVFFYPGLSSGKFGARKQLYKNFGHMRELTAIGDFNRDGYPDMLAAQTSNGNVYLYPGMKGARFGKRTALAYGDWNNRSEFAGVGDFNRDGFQDLLVKLNSTGALYLYRGKTGGFQAALKVGTAAGLRDLLGAGDFDRDGWTDLAAVQSSTGHLMVYRGNGKGFVAGLRVSTGYKGRSPLF
ncbi:glycoside hydrolase domain-containing protein [Actinoplanes xinjiangensis]|uniref:VCBS repeat protein n=1 Tax=Actinoplanes xinjiangensis TaxID=512350 RepID=A0A316F6J2_9ACTN|nr:glycoside hydrolase domain-containing protein [Actinoplanes xinjiangensis]PWK41154.1 VCBS repeat protein [Actinoplanes xinjiangensis]